MSALYTKHLFGCGIQSAEKGLCTLRCQFARNHFNGSRAGAWRGLFSLAGFAMVAAFAIQRAGNHNESTAYSGVARIN